MFAIGAPYAAVAEQLLGLEDRLSVAAVNTEHQTVISGDLPSGMAIATLLRSMGHRVRKLKVSHAFHSPHMNGMLEAYREVAEGLTYHPPTLPVVSCLTGTVASPELLCTADYWVRQVRGAVRFHKGMTAALAEGAERFVECGPHAVLAPMAAEVVAPDMPCIPSLVKGREESVALMEAVGALHTTGAELDWDAVFGDLGGTVVPLPTYAFQRSRYWLEGAGTDDRPLDRAGVEGVRHPILGAEISLPGGGVLFTGRLRPSALPWVADHDVHGQALLPAMAWLDLAMMAGDRVDVGEVSELVFETPLRLGTDPVDIQILLGPDEDGRRTVEGYARRAGDWVRHASGRLTAAGAVQRGRAGRVPEEAETLDLSSMYPFLSGLGLSYGPAFQGLRETRRHGLDLFARVALPEAVTTGGFHAHPALLDAGLHAILAAAGDITQISVPVELESARRGPGRLGREAVVQVRLPDDRPGLPSEASMAFFTPNGELALELDRVLFRGISAKDLVSGGATRRGDLFRMDWTPATLEGGRPRRAACAVVGDGALSHEVAAALRGEGVRVLRLDRLAQVEAGIASYDGEIHGVVLVVGSAGDPRSTTTAALAELQAWTRQLRDERLVIVTSEAVATEAAARCDLDVAGGAACTGPCATSTPTTRGAGWTPTSTTARFAGSPTWCSRPASRSWPCGTGRCCSPSSSATWGRRRRGRRTAPSSSPAAPEASGRPSPATSRPTRRGWCSCHVGGRTPRASAPSSPSSSPWARPLRPWPATSPTPRPSGRCCSATTSWPPCSTLPACSTTG
jgi:polyene macrolide polyketide synthase